ncbi:MAG: nitronate monooxygenase, partial [Chromatiales bacterium]
MLDFKIIGISPFQNPDPGLVIALSKTEALGVLDLGTDAHGASTALDSLVARRPRRFGVLLRPGVAVEDLPEDAVVVLAGPDYPVADWAPRTVLAQVTSLQEASDALSAGAAGLIAKGTESGGRVGEETAFVLLQRLVRQVEAPIWVQGGVGSHTAAACISGGARGVVIDSQLALVRESRLAPAVKEAIASMDGSETITVGGYRVFTRPDLKGLVPEQPEAVVDRLGASDLTRELLPAGQDAAFAADLAERCVTAGGVVSSLLKAMDDSVDGARQLSS